jgi:uncharacterized protein YvpB
VQHRIDASVGALFFQRRGLTGPAPRAMDTGWDPRSLTPYSNGALPVAPGRAQPGAPAPGAGSVAPPGMVSGNTLIRYDAKGQPANYTVLDQGQTNGCGTTSLAMMLNYFAGGTLDHSRESVDRFIRHYDMFSSPGEIAKFAEERGLEASVHSGTTAEDLRRMIDAGLPVQILMDVSEGGDGSGLHYEVVTGHGTGPDGKRYFELTNPWGQREYMAEDVLLQKWTNLKAAGLPIGLDRVAIVMKPPGNPTPLLPDERGAVLNASTVALRVAQGITQVTSGWARSEPHTLAAGVVRTVVGGLGGLGAVLLEPGLRASERMLREGREQVGSGGLATVTGLGKLAGGAALGAVALPASVVSSAISWGADNVASGVEWVGDRVASWFR